METSRRGFFGTIFGAVFAGPAIAREVIKPTQAPGWYPPAPPMGYAGVEATSSGLNNYISRKAIRAMGIPQWMRDEWMRNAQDEARHTIDLDIRAYPWVKTDAVRRALQIERNIKRQEEAFFDDTPRWWQNRDKWFKKLGIDGIGDPE